jgi:hypothetical protein
VGHTIRPAGQRPVRIRSGCRGEAKIHASARREWTILVYLAADNDLSAQALVDLKGMKRGARSSSISVLAELDPRPKGSPSRRFMLAPGGTLESDVVAELGETNSGDPRTLAKFFRWALRAAPAKRYMLVLWGHAQGWDDTDPYDHRRGARKLFSAKARSHDASFPLGRDDTSRDYLDNRELVSVLKSFRKLAGRPPDILGMDVCLMAMVEVLYEIRDHAGLVVASEEIEPTTGWPYSNVIEAFSRDSRASSLTLARKIAREYVASYPDDRRVTQSVLRADHVAKLARALDRLARAVLARWNDERERERFISASDSAWRSRDTPDYVDVVDLCARATRRKATSRSIGGAAAAVVLAARQVVVASGYRSRAPERPRGLSIYLPRSEFQSEYNRVGFARDTRWGDLARAVADAGNS